MAGVATAWTADLLTGRQAATRATAPDATLYDRIGGHFTVVCAALAAAPDLDLVFGWRWHRTYAHSIGAALIVAAAAALIAWRRKRPVLFTSLTCGAAYATHILLDWLGADPTPPYGIMALWPFSHGWYISGLNLFDAVSREYWAPRQFILGNLLNAGWEVVVLGPVLIGLWLIRVKTLARLAPELARGHHAPE